MGSKISVFSNDSMGSRIFVHVAEDEIENIPLHEDIFDTDSEEEESERSILSAQPSLPA